MSQIPCSHIPVTFYHFLCLLSILTFAVQPPWKSKQKKPHNFPNALVFTYDVLSLNWQTEHRFLGHFNHFFRDWHFISFTIWIEHYRMWNVAETSYRKLRITVLPQMRGLDLITNIRISIQGFTFSTIVKPFDIRPGPYISVIRHILISYSHCWNLKVDDS